MKEVTELVNVDEEGFSLNQEGADLAEQVHQAITQAAIQFGVDSGIRVTVLDMSIILGIIGMHYEEQLEEDVKRIEGKGEEA